MRNPLIDATKLVAGSWIVLGAVVGLSGACGSSHGVGAGGAGGSSGTSHGGGTTHAGGSQGTAGGGGGMVPSANADEGGTRLKANIIKGSDGSKHYVGTFHDTQRNEDCSFALAADGKTRCLPKSSFASDLFVDSQCTVPLIEVPACFPKPSYGAVSSGSCAGADLFSVGAKFTGAVIYFGDPSSCAQTSPSPMNALYQLGAKVSPSSFVEGTAATE